MTTRHPTSRPPARRPSMTVRAVHWHEGMFLLPHHFQAAQRHAAAVDARSGKWDHHHNWGLRALDLDADALANHRVVIHALQARLRDGTLVSVPDDGVLSALDLKPAFEAARSATIVLAVPVAKPGRAYASAEPTDRATFLGESLELEDENTRVNPPPRPSHPAGFLRRAGGGGDENPGGNPAAGEVPVANPPPAAAHDPAAGVRGAPDPRGGEPRPGHPPAATRRVVHPAGTGVR